MTDESARMLETALNTVAARAPIHTLPDGGIGIVIPQGYKLHEAPPLNPPLTHIKSRAVFHDEDSFVSYVNTFKTDKTRLFAESGVVTDGRPHISAVFDYHSPPASDETREGYALYCEHRAVYTPRYSTPWNVWTEKSAPMTQHEFAEFVEENRKDIVDPDAAALLDVVRTFKANKRVDFDSLVYQPNSSVKLVYDEKTEGKGASGDLPEIMRLGIPVYFRGTPYEVPVFVRYRVATAKVMFHLKVDRADIIEDEAFAELMQRIADGTQIEVYLGRL